MQNPGNNSYELFYTIHVQEEWIQAKVIAEMGYPTVLGNGEPGMWEENGRLWSGASRVWGLMSWRTKYKKWANNY